MDLFYSEKSNFNQDTIPVFEAIFKKDTQFFLEPTENQQELLAEVFHINNAHGDLFISNFLLESIRHSFLPAVKYMLENYHQSTLVLKDGTPSASFDPVSLAIITYASLKENHPSKKEAKDIISFIDKIYRPCRIL